MSSAEICYGDAHRFDREGTYGEEESREQGKQVRLPPQARGENLA